MPTVERSIEEIYEETEETEAKPKRKRSPKQIE
eukprot:SAG11_NODE_25580_length_356_cov_163.241245_1_plen_32_part_10